MKKKVLIVEDDAIVARDIQQILKKNNFSVVGIANSAKNALDLFNHFKVDLILCDINLGKGGSGIDLIKIIKSKNENIHVIFLSAYSDEHTVNNAFETTPNSYVTKPFTEEQLIVATKRVFATASKQKIKTTGNAYPTRREMQILKQVAKGHTSKEIAEKLGISFETVQTHRKNLLNKFNLNSSAELIAYSLKSKWID